jgi:FkbM family methyltransferase
MANPDAALSALQRDIDAVVLAGGRVHGLTDQAIAETVLRDYFRAQPQPRHLVDVGAAYGSIAGIFLADGWTADLFEPDPACTAALGRLVAKYGPRLRLFPLAVAREAQASAVFHQNAVAGLSGLQPSPFGSPRAAIRVETVRLGDFLAARGVRAVDLLKIDTEGSDFDVLDSHDFTTLAPALAFVEFSFYFPGQTAGALAAAIAAMRGRGYDAVVFEYRDDGNFRRNDWSHRLVGIHLDAARQPSAADAFGNVLFYRAGDVRLLDALADTVDACS